MIHCVCFPSATVGKAAEAAREWKAKGYTPVVMLDPGCTLQGGSWLVAPAPFPGYYRVANGIARVAFAAQAFRADVCTFAADDMAPPVQGAEWVADVYFTRFKDGFGVLQGTGDMQGGDSSGRPASARVCGSPTFGRGWYERAYGGRGPFHDGYRSFYGDEDMHEVARRLGVLWLEPNIKIDHRHWSFGRAQREEYHERASKNWTEDQALFFRRKAEGFPGREPLPPGTVGRRDDSVLPVVQGEEGLG